MRVTETQALPQRGYEMGESSHLPSGALSVSCVCVWWP